MSRMFIFFMLFIGAVAFSVPEAEAKRFGGGGSFGKQRSVSPAQQRQAQPAPSRQQQNQAAPNRQGQQSSGASRWLGPLAGLAAGGLLAAMLFGDGFSGLQIMDFLLIAALAVGAFFLFRMLRRRTASAPQPSPASGPSYDQHEDAGDGEFQREQSAPTAGSGSRRFEVPEIGSDLADGDGVGRGGASAEAIRVRPDWFDEASFLEGAKTHFIRLQAAWDKADMQDIREYTTPELFAHLTLERQKLAGENFTEVVSLETELLDLAEEGDVIIASIRYVGLVREERGAEPTAIREIWHVQRAVDNPQADWFIAGIQQEEESD